VGEQSLNIAGTGTDITPQLEVPPNTESAMDDLKKTLEDAKEAVKNMKDCCQTLLRRPTLC